MPVVNCCREISTGEEWVTYFTFHKPCSTVWNFLSKTEPVTIGIMQRIEIAMKFPNVSFVKLALILSLCFMGWIFLIPTNK